MVPRQDRVRQLRDDGLVVADDAGEERLLPAETILEVLADLVFDWSPAILPPVDRGLQLSKGFNAGRRGHMAIMTRGQPRWFAPPTIRGDPSAGVRASRRRQAGTREHAGRLRARVVAWRRRARTRRAPGA